MALQTIGTYCLTQVAFIVALGAVPSPTLSKVSDVPEITYEAAGLLDKACNSKDTRDAELCFVFVGAILEVAANNRLYGHSVCVPPRTSVSKAVQLTQQWLRDHPSEQTRPGSFVVVQALAGSFVCK